MAEREIFSNCCNDASRFPETLVYTNTYEHTITANVKRLDQEERRLFCAETLANIELWEYKDSSSGFESIHASSHIHLQSVMKGKQLFDQVDPQSRFVFIHSKHSREQLKATRQMLMFVFTYHQVMPAFIDFIFPFGKQDRQQDFHFSSLRHEIRCFTDEKALQLLELGRSGQDFRLCYNLKSVEVSLNQPHWPWSVRQSAMYHSFDVVTGKSFWIFIKGDDLIERRIKNATKRTQDSGLDLATSVSCDFAATLAVHMILLDWCGENWRWYINHLEEAHQEITRPALLTSFDRPSNRSLEPLQRTSTPSPIHPIKRTFSRALKRAASATGTLLPEFPLSTLRTSHIPPPPEFEQDLKSHEPFDFAKLQQVQTYEERVNQVLLTLESNITIVTSLRAFYEELFDTPGFPQDIKADCFRQILRFQKTCTNTIIDLGIQNARAKTLLSTIKERKNLLCEVLNYCNMEASKNMAEETHRSTIKMEAMTEEMNHLAVKTKQETVSMKIITLVTLFFLPGTFISTIMSTDIINYPKNDTTNVHEKDFSLQALKLYLSVTVPMTALVFAMWYVVYWWVNRKEYVQAMKKTIKRMHGTV